jgi:Transglutaminase-like superfamily.
MKKLIYILPLFLICIKANTANYPANVQNVLQKAGKNRPELEKVLKHYRNDSLKYKAACFLIGNMDIHTAQSHYWADSINREVKFDELSYPNYETAVKSFNATAAKTKLHPVPVKVPDVESVTAKYLIRNIDQAFEIRQKPWARNLSFSQFCDYLLSYRVLNEPHGEWRNSFRKVFSSYTSPLATKNARTVCTVLSDSLRKWFTNTYNVHQKNVEPGRLSPQQLLFRRQGMCEDMADWGSYILRSIGIASTVDFTPAWATSTGSHFWNVAFSESGTPIPFFMGDDSPNEFYMVREPSKVLRVTYSNQPSSLAATVGEEEIPEGFLRNRNYIDVTRDYWKVAHLKVALDSVDLSQKNAYISVFNGLNWRSVWWSRVEEGNADFSDMSCGVVYLPMYYKNRSLSPAADPVILRPDSSVQVLHPDVYRLRTVRIEQQDKYLK